jgi:hypothetical protein
MFSSSKMVTVLIAHSLPEAEIIRGRLVCEGIDSVLKYESAGRIIGVTVDGLGEIEIQVPEAQRKKALEILSRAESDYPTEPDR